MAFLTISNILSLSRAPLALLFIPQLVVVRVVVLLLAALTDYLDGFIARRFGLTTQIGAVLDPVMDKFFMFFVIAILLSEGVLSPIVAVALISRDLFLFLFCVYLALSGQWKAYKFRAIWWGKVVTVAQYLCILALLLGMTPSPLVFTIFPLFGLLYFGELLLYHKQVS